MKRSCGPFRSAWGASIFYESETEKRTAKSDRIHRPSRRENRLPPDPLVDFIPWTEEDNKKIQGGSAMKKLIICLVLILVCLSCSSTPKRKRILVKDVSEAELQKDRYECKTSAELVCHMYGPGNTFVTLPANIACFKSHFYECMQSRGYRWVER